MAKINIIVITYGEYTTPLMNSCLKSLNAQSFKDFKILSASSGTFIPEINNELRASLFGKHDHWHLEEMKHFPEKAKYLEQFIDQDCEYIAILNDDVILNHKCLEYMLLSFGMVNNQPMIMEPQSNCEMGRLYVRPQRIEFKGVIRSYEQPQYRLADLSPDDIDHIIYGTYIHDANLQITSWVAFYCAMMQRETYFKVGGIDPVYKTGQDDLDFCLRASKLGIPSAVTSSCFVLHYSGITADKVLTREERVFNVNHYNQKHKDSLVGSSG